MKALRKTIITLGITSMLLCTTAFATEVETTTNEPLQIESQSIATDNLQAENTVETSTRKGVVTVDILNVRSGQSTSTEILGKLSLGTTVDILAEENGWYEINFELKKAYIYSEYVRIVDNTLSSAQTTGLSVVDYAKTLLGTPYVYGGNSPKGFDCSGFVQYVMANFGITMPRTSTEQYSIGVRVDKSVLMPGDLVYFKYSNNTYRLSHVGIYVGDGNFIHSPVPGQSVKISSLASGYFSDYYYGATRVIK